MDQELLRNTFSGVNQELVIEIIAVIVPLVAGGVFAVIGLAKAYPNYSSLIYRTPTARLYVLLSSVGSLLVTLTMKAVGTQVIAHTLLNNIFLGLLGSGLFLGIISNLPVGKVLTNETSAQFKTLRDYIYSFLDDSLNRQVRQMLEYEIAELEENFDDVKSFLKETKKLLNGLSLPEDKKTHLILEFDQFADQGDYCSIIRELVNYCEFNDLRVRLLSSYVRKYLINHQHTLKLEIANLAVNLEGRVDNQQLLKESKRLLKEVKLNGMGLPKERIQALILELDEYADRGDYYSIICELALYHEIKYLKKRIIALLGNKAQYPKNGFVWVRRGETYRVMKRYKEALNDFNRALEFDPENDWLLYNRALVYLALGEKDKGQADLTKAIQSTQQHLGKDWWNRFNLALYYLAAGRGEQAERNYRALLSKKLPSLMLRDAMYNLDDFLVLFPDHPQAKSMRELLQAALK